MLLCPSPAAVMTCFHRSLRVLTLLVAAISVSGAAFAQEQTPLSDETAAQLKTTIMALRRMADEDNPRIKSAAIQALAPLQAYDPSVGDLIRGLGRHQNVQIREAVVDAITGNVALARDSVPLLIELLGDANLQEASREKIRTCLLSYVAANEVVAAGVTSLESPQASVRQAALEILTALGYRAKDSIPAVLEVASNSEQDEVTRAAAIKALGGITSASVILETQERKLQAQALAMAKESLERSDANKDGKITRDESVMLRREALLGMSSGRGGRSGRGGQVVDNFVVQSINTVDVDGDGVATLEELTQFYVSRLQQR